MADPDLIFLENSLTSFIDASINRVAEVGTMEHCYRISAADLKSATNRTRLREETVEKCKNYFESNGAEVNYYPTHEQFSINVNLTRCVMNPRQAENFSIALAYYKTNNC